MRPHAINGIGGENQDVTVQVLSGKGLDVVKVRYEDLVSHPEQVIPHVLERLGIPPAIECLPHHEVYQGRGPGRTIRCRRLDTESIGKWSTSPSKRQADGIWEMVGDFMKTSGYGQFGPASSPFH